MSKELTEQWRNGMLPQGYYYIVANTEQKHKVVFYLPERSMEYEVRLALKDQFVLEVLSPVPNYNQFVELTEKVDQFPQLVKKVEDLEQDNKCLKSGIDTYESQLSRISEQLKEANEVILNMKLCMNDKYDYDCVAEDVDNYLEKWGVK